MKQVIGKDCLDKKSSLHRQDYEKKPLKNKTETDLVLQLQHSVGNQTVQRLIKSGVLRPKLKISQPTDIYEEEADRMAEQVVNMLEPIAPNTISNQLSRKCDMCKEEEMKIHRKAGNDLKVSDDVTRNIESIRGGGVPLDDSTKNFMEARFGFDFRKVRIHNDERAAKSAESINALAYSIGNDIVFGKGQYQPHTIEGTKLLAHELTHTLQTSISSETNSINTKFILRKPAVKPAQKSKNQSPKAEAVEGHSIPLDLNEGVKNVVTRTIEEWKNGADLGIEEFRRFLMEINKEPEQFWLKLAVEVASIFLPEVGVVAESIGMTEEVAKKSIELTKIGISKLQESAEKNEATLKGKSIDEIYTKILQDVNDAADAMEEEENLNAYAAHLIARKDIREAFEKRDGAYYQSKIREDLHLPGISNPMHTRNNVKQYYVTELLKKYWSESETVPQVEFIYMAMQSTPGAINIPNRRLEWVKIAKKIKEGDAAWHIYKDKKIILEAGDQRVEIPPNTPLANELKQIMDEAEKNVLE